MTASVAVKIRVQTVDDSSGYSNQTYFNPTNDPPTNDSSCTVHRNIWVCTPHVKSDAGYHFNGLFPRVFNALRATITTAEQLTIIQQYDCWYTGR